MKATIRKCELTDYRNFRDDRIYTGRPYEIIFANGTEMHLPGSWSKARVCEYVEIQCGYIEFEWAA